MLSKKLKIILLSLLLITVISGQTEKYFPDYSFYKTGISKKFKDVEIEFGKLESTLRLSGVGLFQNKSENLMTLPYPFVSEMIEWAPGELSGNNNFLGSTEDFLFREVLKNGTGKLVRMKDKLVFAVPTEGKLLLAILYEKELKSFRKEGSGDYFYPEISSAKIDDNPGNTSGILSDSINKKFSFGKSNFSVQDRKYDSYYGSPEDKRYGFVEEILFLKSRGGFFGFYGSLFTLFAAIALADALVYFKRKAGARPTESIFTSHNIREKEAEINSLLEKAQAGPLSEKNEVEVSAPVEESQEKYFGEYSEKPIFILPFDLVPAGKREIIITPQFLRKIREEEKTRKESVKTGVQLAREKVFNPQLENLISKVDKKTPLDEKNLDQKYKELFAKIFSEDNKELYQSLNELYDHDYHEHESLGYLKRITKKVGLDSLCLSIYNRSMGCYMVSLAMGIDDETRTNLIFQWNDPFLQFEKGEEIIEIFFNNKLMTNLFFRKKFSSDTLARFGGMLVYPLKKYSVDGYFIFFFEKNVHITPEKLKLVSECLNRMIVPFLPIVNGIAKEKIYLQIPDEDILAKIFQEMKEATNAGLESCVFVKIRLKKMFQTENSKEIREEIIQGIKNLLKSGEKILATSPVDLLVVTRDISEREFLKEIDKINAGRLDLKINISRYPDDGKNFYNYL